MQNGPTFLLLVGFFCTFRDSFQSSDLCIDPENMRAIIPVAGVGTRLRPHTFQLPKVLLNVAGKPILGHILDKIIGEGFSEATIVVGHMGDKIMEYLSTRLSRISTWTTWSRKSGWGWATRSIFPARRSAAEPALIILGDTIFDVDLAPVLAGPDSSLGVKTVDDPRRFGVAVVENGYITRLVEKPEEPVSNLAVVGPLLSSATRKFWCSAWTSSSTRTSGPRGNTS